MKRSLLLQILFLTCCLLLTYPLKAHADLVTAYTFEPVTEFRDVAVMLGGGGVASDNLACSGSCSFDVGVFGQAIEVGLADYFTTLGNSSDLDPGPNGFTVAFYTKGTEWGDVAGGHMVTKYLPSNGWHIMSGGFTTGYHPMTIESTLSDNADYHLLTVPDETVEAAWRHIAMTYDGISSAKLYIDGELRAERNDVSFTPAGVGLYFGVASHDPHQDDHAYGGFFDDVAIFNEVLPAEAIELLSELGIEAYYDVIANYPIFSKTTFKAKGLGKIVDTDDTDELILNGNGTFSLGPITGLFSLDNKGKKILLEIDAPSLAVLAAGFAEMISDLILDKEGISIDENDITVDIQDVKISKIKIDKKTDKLKGKLKATIKGIASADVPGEGPQQTKFSFKGKFTIQ